MAPRFHRVAVFALTLATAALIGPGSAHGDHEHHHAPGGSSTSSGAFGSCSLDAHGDASGCGGHGPVTPASYAPPHQRDEHTHDHGHDDAHTHDHGHSHDDDHTHDRDHTHDHGHSHGDGAAAGGSTLHVLLREDQKHAWSAVGLTFLSGGAAVLGGVIVVMCGSPSRAAMGHMLSFAAGVMLYISYADLLPHALAHMEGVNGAAPRAHDHGGHDHGHEHAGSLDAFRTTAVWFFGGMVVFVGITMLVPDADAHVHAGEPTASAGELPTPPPQPSLTRAASSTGGVSLATARKAADALGLTLPPGASRDEVQDQVAAAARAQLDALQVVKLRDVAHGLGVDIASHSGARKSDLQAALRDALEKRGTAPPAAAPAPTAVPPPAPVAAPAARDPMLTTGLVAAIGISLHNLPEGLIVFNQTITGICAEPPAGQPFDYRLCFGRGMVITLAIALHNIPEGMAVASPLYVATGSRWTALKYCIFSALCEPLAAILFGALFSSFLTPYVLAGINAAVAGIMVALCLVELVPAAADSVGHRAAAASNIAGQVLMAVSLYAMRSTGVH